MLLSAMSVSVACSDLIPDHEHFNKEFVYLFGQVTGALLEAGSCVMTRSRADRPDDEAKASKPPRSTAPAVVLLA